MAKIVPVKGYHYNQQKITHFKSVICPTDQLSIDDPQVYYQHQYNIAHLAYPQGDNNQANQLWQSWLDDNITMQAEKPALYYYQQDFAYNGTEHSYSGFICGVQIEAYDQGIILPHQKVLPTESDRQLKWLQQSQVQLCPVHALYADFSFKIDKLLAQAATGQSDIDFVDMHSTRHQITAITDPKIISQVQQAMAEQKLFIASGHHHYDAALRYTQQNSRASYVLMTLGNLYQPSLQILPVHRLVNIKPFNLENLINQLKEEFIVEEFDVQPDGSNIDEFLRYIHHKGGFDRGLGIDHRRAYGLYTTSGSYVVTLEDEGAMDRLLPWEGYTLALQGLDVFVLHYAVLKDMLGIGKESQQTTAEKDDTKNKEQVPIEYHIDYTGNALTALDRVNSGAFNIAFLMNPVVKDEYTAVTIGGERMPAKSTRFIPNPAAGLIMYRV